MDQPEHSDRAVVEPAPARVPEFTLEEWLVADQPGDAAVRVSAEADLDEHYQRLSLLSSVIVEFPVFTDGRGFSHARKLRELGFGGTLIAAGDVLADQWQFLQRCGFSAMESTEQPAVALPRFSDAYQGDVQQPIPLFRRR